MVKSEKEYWASDSTGGDDKKRQHHKSHVMETLAGISNLVLCLQSMFWNWHNDIVELAAAEAGSDAAGLSEVKTRSPPPASRPVSTICASCRLSW